MNAVKILLSRAQFGYYVKAYVPHWHACVLGPVPLGGSERFVLACNEIVHATEDDAIRIVYEHIEAACADSGFEYDPSEWDIAHLVLLNGN